MKAGTTTLSTWLAQHPGLYLCRPKEPQFFSRAEAASRGWAWYSALFEEAEAGQLLGEASTCYTRWPQFGDVAGRLGEAVPGARLIYLVRHPVERAYSHYRHEMQRVLARGETPLDFETALQEIPEIIDASLYGVQIDRMLEHYSSDRILILLTDDLKERPTEVWNDVQTFLGVDLTPVPDLGAGRANEFGDHLAKRAMENRLAGAYDSWPLRLARRFVSPELRLRIRKKLIDPRVSRRLLRDRVEAGLSALSPLREETRLQLLERYQDTTRNMERRLGRDLTEWLR